MYAWAGSSAHDDSIVIILSSSFDDDWWRSASTGQWKPCRPQHGDTVTLVIKSSWSPSPSVLTRMLLALFPLIWPVSGQVLLIFLINTLSNVPRNIALKQKRLSSIYYFQHFSTLALGHSCHDVLAPAAGWDLQKPSRAEVNLVKVFFLYCSVLYDLIITDIVSKPGQFMNRNLGKFPSALDFYLSIF